MQETTKTTEIHRLRGIIFRLYNLCGIQKFEPDKGKPHPLKDGMYDKIMHEASLELEGYEP